MRAIFKRPHYVLPPLRAIGTADIVPKDNGLSAAADGHDFTPAATSWWLCVFKDAYSRRCHPVL